ncbi:MAG: hypothetical protein ABJB05_01575 [Parafilimonas sp.]
MKPISVQSNNHAAANNNSLFPIKNNNENKLSTFSIKDETRSCVIALDACKKNLLFIKKQLLTSDCLIIDLDNLNGCSITKEYNNITPGALKTKKLNRFLKNIFLNLRSNKGPVSLSIYNYKHDAPEDAQLLEVKAKKWQTIVSKLLPQQIKSKEGYFKI